jgi:hypothetical protein
MESFQVARAPGLSSWLDFLIDKVGTPHFYSVMVENACNLILEFN